MRSITATRYRWIVTLALLASGPLAKANWVASGQFNYTNRLYAAGGYTGTESRPIRQADIEVIDASTGSVLATGTTGYDGRFSVSVNDSATRSVAVRVL